MSWCITDFTIFLFIYTCNGSPLGDRPRSEEAEPTQYIPAQWAKDSKIAYQWANGEVPYYFDTKSYDDGIKGRVLMAMASLERDSCIRFKEQYQIPTNDSGSWIHFTNPNTVRHCFHDCSYKANGEVEVVLGYDCLKQKDITHAVLHGIGFRDEVAHPQRDLYIKIMWSNIQPAYRSMFRIQPVDSLGLVEYDPLSIMQFHERAFSLNGQATITPLLPGLKIQPSEDLSHLDKMKLRIMFGHECNKRKVHEVLDTCQNILSEINKNVKSGESKNDGQEKNVVGESNKNGEEDGNKSYGMDVEGNNNEKASGNENNGNPSEEMIVVGDNNEKGSGNKNNGNPSEEMIVVGDNNEKGSGNKNIGNPSEEMIVVGDNNEKGSSNKNNGSPSEEMIVVGDDVGKGSGNKNNGSPSEEMIVVGEDVGKGSGNENNKNPSEEIIVVGDNNVKGSGNENNGNPSEEMINVGDNNEKGSVIENNGNPSDEMIIVGNDLRKDSRNENNKNPSVEMIVEGDGRKTDKNNHQNQGGGGAFSPLESGHEKSKSVIVGKSNINSIRNNNNLDTKDDKKELSILSDRNRKSAGVAKGIKKIGKVINVKNNQNNDVM